MMDCVIGVDIGGTKIAASLVLPDGSLYGHRQSETPLARGIVTQVIALCQALREDAQRQGYRIRALGVGTAGQVDSQTGRISYAVETVPDWTGTELARPLEAALSVPVIVENDVNAFILGEARYGSARGYQQVLGVAVGTGVGGGLLLDGKLVRGAHFSGGEIGHILVDWQSERLCSCGAYGHLEAYASGPALAQRYYALAGLPPSADLRPVVQAERDGSALAKQVLAEGGRILGMALNGLRCAFDPELVVIGGGVASIGGAWWSALQHTLQQGKMPAIQRGKVCLAELGTGAVLSGAGVLAYELWAGST